MSSAERSDLTDADLPQERARLTVADDVLFERIRLGQRTALRELMERYWATLVGYAVGITHDRDAAQDVAQGTFVQVWAKRSDWRASGTPRAYLYRITRNLALNAQRDDAVRERRHAKGAVGEGTRPAPPTPEEEIETQRLRAEIEAAIADLSERRREVFLLSRFEGLTHREIAETLEISLQTVSNQMSAALAQLRVALANHLEE